MTAPIASGWSESPGGPCTHWKAPPFHGARRKRSLQSRGTVKLAESGQCPIDGAPGTASPSLNLEDTSPPWSAGAARPECGHCWQRPTDSEPPGTERIQGQCAALVKIT